MNQDAKAWRKLCLIGFSARIAYIGVRCGLFGSFTSSFIQFLLLYTRFLHHPICLLWILQYSSLHSNRYSVVEFGWIVIRNGNLECKCSRHCNYQIVHSVWLCCTAIVPESDQTVTQIWNLHFCLIGFAINEARSDAKHFWSVLFFNNC